MIGPSKIIKTADGVVHGSPDGRWAVLFLFLLFASFAMGLVMGILI